MLHEDDRGPEHHRATDAVPTMASAPASTCGHQASILARTRSTCRCVLVEVMAQCAIQQLPAATRFRVMPARSKHARCGGINGGRHRILHTVVGNGIVRACCAVGDAGRATRHRFASVPPATMATCQL